MTGVVTKSVLLLALNAAVGLSYVGYLNLDRRFEPWETQSALYKIPPGGDHDWLFLGSSHAEVLGHCPENVAYIQSTLGGTAAIVSKRGSGVLQHRLFLEAYFRAGNRADTIIYLVDPWAFYSRYWNESMRFIDYEPIDLPFMWGMVKSGVSASTLVTYVRSKFTRDWYERSALPADPGACLRKLEERSPAMVERSIRRFFPDGTDSTVLERYMRELQKIVSLARARGSRLVLITPPTLLGELPGTESFHSALEAMAAPQGVAYHDFSDAVEDVAMFHDHDHLNDDGVRYFVETRLAPALR